MPERSLLSTHDIGTLRPDRRGRTGLDRVDGNLTRHPDVIVDDVEVVSDGWGVLRLTTFRRRRPDGTWATEQRETYDRGNSVSILLYDTGRRTVLLTRQFRYPAFSNGHPDGMLIEATAGEIDDGEDPVTAICRETEEELGVRISAPEHLFSAFLSPGAPTERQDFFAAEYSAPDRAPDAGGGLAKEGEDIEVLEIDFGRALAMTLDGTIVDAKTIILLQWAALHGPFRSAGS